MTEIIGYIAFVFIGFVLGVIGGGGSMLAVPVLVYLFADSVSVDQATTYSLFIVGVTSLFGSYSSLAKGDFKLEAIYLFALPSLISIFITRKYLMPCLPEVIFSFTSFNVTKNMTVLLTFSALIIFASYGMIKKNRNVRKKDLMWGEFFRTPLKIPFIVLLGVMVGLVSGFVGAGGGFMIIPVLVIFLRIPMKQAIGTSLLIIAINSVVGFLGNIGGIQIDWKFLAIVVSLSVVGIFLGRYVSRYVSGKKLKPAFGWFALVVGFFILIKEIFLK